jgi:aspartate/methionine/tyrosine aminotransferase
MAREQSTLNTVRDVSTPLDMTDERRPVVFKTMNERALSSDYMHWAKTQAGARFNLATSGMPNFPLAELPVRIEELELTGDSGYGYPPLQQALAKKLGVAQESIVAAAGTSMANHLAMVALVAPGDEVAIEHPTYGLLLEVARYLGAHVNRFHRKIGPSRTGGNRFGVNVEEISEQLTSRTRLVVLTNLHNPSSALIDESTLKQIGDAVRRVGARVLVDEAYLEAAYACKPRSAFHLGEEFVVTGSLTKFYGLSGLRCGWILAEPKLAENIWRLNDLFSATSAHPAERLSAIALQNLDHIAERSRSLLEANRPLLVSFLRSRKDLEWAEQKYGTVVFPRVLHADVEKLCALLAEKYETSVVPGKFFEMPNHIRIGVGCATETLRAGLERLGGALEELG